MEIFIIGKTQDINCCKTIIQYTQQLQYMFLIFGPRQILNTELRQNMFWCENKEKLVEIIELQLFGSLKLEGV